jgi:putative signal transducing protein
MKKCPYCGRENEAVALVCVECAKEFESASPPAEVEPELLDPGLSPVVVATFSSLPEASLLVGRLEAAGIEAHIPEEYSAQIFSAVIALEPLTVRVAAKDYDAAMRIIAEGSEAPPTEAQAEGSFLSNDSGRRGTISEPESQRDEDPSGGKLCVSCGAAIPQAARQCHKCGWTQPDAL